LKNRAVFLSTEAVEKLWIGLFVHRASHSTDATSRVLHNRAASTELATSTAIVAAITIQKNFMEAYGKPIHFKWIGWAMRRIKNTTALLTEGFFSERVVASNKAIADCDYLNAMN